MLSDWVAGITGLNYAMCLLLRGLMKSDVYSVTYKPGLPQLHTVLMTVTVWHTVLIIVLNTVLNAVIHTLLNIAMHSPQLHTGDTATRSPVTAGGIGCAQL